MTDRKGIILYQSFGNYLLVALARPDRIGEVVREIGPDQSFPSYACCLLGRLVHVGDLAVGADRDKRVEARLQKTSRIGRCFAQLGLDIPRVLPRLYS